MPSRREIIQLSDDEIRDYLAAQKTLIIVSNGKDGYPHPMPMWFYADDAGCLYCTTFSKAQKVLNFQRDAKATLLVESGEEYAQLKSVLIYATAEVIDDFDAVCDALVGITTKGRDNVSAEEVAKLRAGVAKTAEKRVALKFTPQRYVSWDHSKLGGKY
jgi:nitroimidazol reductase NimA-like FMN-containing flavoprotein (pyridoxamine 5'-phosphate oxidase superfamily)